MVVNPVQYVSVQVQVSLMIIWGADAVVCKRTSAGNMKPTLKPPLSWVDNWVIWRRKKTKPGFESWTVSLILCY